MNKLDVSLSHFIYCDEENKRLFLNLKQYSKLYAHAYSIFSLHIIPGAFYIELIHHILQLNYDLTCQGIKITSFNSCNLPIFYETKTVDGEIEINIEGKEVTFCLCIDSTIKALCRSFKYELFNTIGIKKHTNYLQLEPLQSLNMKKLYKDLRLLGVDMSGDFQNIGLTSMGEASAFSSINNTSKLPFMKGNAIHAMFQLVTFYLAFNGSYVHDLRNEILLPGVIGNIKVFPHFFNGNANEIILEESPGNKLNVVLLDTNQNILVKISDIQYRKIDYIDLEKIIIKDELNTQSILLLDNMQKLVSQIDDADGYKKFIINSSIIFILASKILMTSDNHSILLK